MTMKYLNYWTPLLAWLALATTLGASPSAAAQQTLAPAAAAESESAPRVAGEVRKVDTEAGKITLRHGDIPNLEMPPMTMVFRVASPDFLSKVKAGDQVLFSAEKRNGALTVTAIDVRPDK
jgi:Cu/Ag efflux protein CusF